MPRINLQFGVEGTADVTRAVLGLSAAMKRVFAEMKTEAAKAAAATVAGQRQTVVAERAALEQRKALIHRAYDDWKKSERALTDAVSKGSHDRDRIAKTETATRQKYLDSLKVSAGQVEREWTRIMEEEARKRDAIREREASAASRGGGGGGRHGGMATAVRSTLGSALGVAQDTHGQIQDARRTRAGTTQTLIGALAQVGGNRAGVQDAMRRLSAAARESGITADDLAGAVSAAQTEFSVLGNREDYRGMDPTQRQAAINARLQENLDIARRGRNLGSDPAEFLRLSGMFRQQGLRGPALDQLLANAVSMAQHGSTELSAITRTAMTPIMRQMGTELATLGPGASEEERQAAIARSFNRGFASTQVLGQRGYTPRMAAMTQANLDIYLSGNTGAERIRHNLEVAQRTAQGPLRDHIASLLSDGASGMFEADPANRGRMRLREGLRGNSIALASAFHDAGLGSTEMTNIVAGGGAGNRQGLMANMRNLTGALMTENAQGVSGYSAIKELSQATLSRAEEHDMADVFENSPMAELNRNEERRLGALTDNSSRLVELSNRIAAFTAAHPLGMTVAENFGNVAGTAFGAVIGRLLGGGGAGALANGGGSLLSTVVQGGGAGIGLGAGGLAAMGLIGGGALAAGAYMDRQHYLGQYGLSGNDVDWLGRPTIVGGQESITNLIRENDRNRHNRQLANADDFDAAHGSDAAAQRFMGTDEGRDLARRTWGGTTVFSGHREVGADGVAHTVATGSQYIEGGARSDAIRAASANTPGANEANTFLAGAIGAQMRQALASTVIRVSMDAQDTSHNALNAASDGGSPGTPPPTSPAAPSHGGTGNSYMDGLGG